jgi:glucosamine-6-phosphate deaminase
MGIGTILDAKRLRVLAFGETKAEILGRVLRGEDDPSIPLNALRRHPDSALYIDEAAASRLG